MPREHRGVQHVGVGEDDVRLLRHDPALPYRVMAMVHDTRRQQQPEYVPKNINKMEIEKQSRQARARASFYH